MMKKIFITLSILVITSLVAFADEQQEAIDFFNGYVNAANNYSSEIAKMYSPSAKIIRQVVKPDGGLVDVSTNTSTYMTQLKLGQAGAKLKKYKNTYKNITVTPATNGAFKVSSLRQPTGESYWLKTYMIVKKQPDGKWLIIEEMMQTKEQVFLKYAK